MAALRAANGRISRRGHRYTRCSQRSAVTQKPRPIHTGLTRLTDRVRQESQGDTKLFIQLIDFLQSDDDPSLQNSQQVLAITESHRQALGLEEASEGDVRLALQKLSPMELSEILTTREIEALNYGQRERVTDIHLPQIADLPKQLPALFAQAARRARTAGFDGIELHFAHAYTVASFLSRTNDRDDSYGGCAEARVKLALEIIDAVRSTVGRDYVVGSRILTEECIPGGSTIDDSLYYAEQFAHQGLDYISLSREENSMMPNNRKSVGLSTPTQVQAAMSACLIPKR